jgi:hypothetical protein
MASSSLGYRPVVLVTGLGAAVALAVACGGSAKQGSGQTSTGTGGGTSGTTSTTTASGTGGAGGTVLSLPQLVHGAAYVDTSLFPSIPIVVPATGATPDSVEVSVDGTVTAATSGTNGWVANVAMTLAPGPHTLVATAKQAGATTGMVTGSLTAGAGSFEYTHVATDGIAYDGNLVHDVAGDALVYTWVSAPAGGKHQLWMNRLDGAFSRLLPADVALNDPADEPLSGYTALSAKGLGVVYKVQKPNDPHWLVKMRAVDAMGHEIVPVTDLTQGQAAFALAAAGADPGGFSAAWLHISPPGDGGASPPVQIRFARWDLGAKKLVGPLTLDMDQPPDAADSTMSPQALEPLAEMSIACNASVCLVSYVRDLWNDTTALNEQKVFVAAVDLASGAPMGTPSPVAPAGNYDPQFFGNQIVALSDGTFVLVYQETLLIPPACSSAMYGAQDMCCQAGSEESDAFYTAKLDATGKLSGAPTLLYRAEGTREYPRIAPHPDGFALFWEDQRTECAPAGGYIRMAANVTGPGLSGLLDPYVEVPGSIAVPPESPSLAVAGTNAIVSWSDNRHGQGLLEDDDEQYLDTYWRK